MLGKPFGPSIFVMLTSRHCHVPACDWVGVDWRGCQLNDYLSFACVAPSGGGRHWLLVYAVRLRTVCLQWSSFRRFHMERGNCHVNQIKIDELWIYDFELFWYWQSNGLHCYLCLFEAPGVSQQSHCTASLQNTGKCPINLTPTGFNIYYFITP